MLHHVLHGNLEGILDHHWMVEFFFICFGKISGIFCLYFRNYSYLCTCNDLTMLSIQLKIIKRI